MAWASHCNPHVSACQATPSSLSDLGLHFAQCALHARDIILVPKDGSGVPICPVRSDGREVPNEAPTRRVSACRGCMKETICAKFSSQQPRSDGLPSQCQTIAADPLADDCEKDERSTRTPGSCASICASPARRNAFDGSTNASESRPVDVGRGQGIAAGTRKPREHPLRIPFEARPHPSVAWSLGSPRVHSPFPSLSRLSHSPQMRLRVTDRRPRLVYVCQPAASDTHTDTTGDVRWRAAARLGACPDAREGENSPLQTRHPPLPLCVVVQSLWLHGAASTSSGN